MKSSDRREGLHAPLVIAGAATGETGVLSFGGSVDGGIRQQHATRDFEGLVRAVVPAWF